MTGIGMNLTEYTYQELHGLMGAVLRQQVHFEHLGEVTYFKELEILSLWQTKIIEAMVEVRIKENIQSN